MVFDHCGLLSIIVLEHMARSFNCAFGIVDALLAIVVHFLGSFYCISVQNMHVSGSLHIVQKFRSTIIVDINIYELAMMKWLLHNFTFWWTTLY
jgi:hypothetical protein